MDLKRLRYFVAVAEAGHITRAAERLGMQQPPLSQQIKALEAQVGVPLFRRHPRGVALTKAGTGLLADARRIIGDVDTLVERLGRRAAGLHGRLSVGFTSSAAAHRFTPDLLRSCRQRFPGIELALDEDNAAGIIDLLTEVRLDCGLLRVPTSRPAGIVFETLLREAVVVALPVGHRLLGGKGRRTATSLRLADLHEESLILVRRPGAPGLYANLLSRCSDARIVPKVVAEVERMMTNLNLVAAGAGISVVPDSMRGIHPHAVVYCPLVDATGLDAPLTLAWREGEDAGVVGNFVHLARDVATRFSGR
jgi:DNA-binding transcriptional LysR family regulator